jgi:hypothetical protein
MDKILNPPAIHGPVVPGNAELTRKQLEQVIKKINSSAFDIGELLHTIKTNNWYEGYNTFTEYTNTLEIKPSKARYLRRIAEVMHQAGVPREKYEPIGVAKLREITSLDYYGTWVNPETKEETPISAFVESFVENGKDMPFEEIKNHVKTLKGLVGDEAMEWVHIYVKKSALDNVIKPAFDKMKMLIGTVKVDDDGMGKDASDGSALEKICVGFLLEPIE